MRTRKLVENIFGSAAARLLNLLIALALVPLTINALSSHDYAILAMAISLSVLSAYADLGMGLAIVNVIAARSPSTPAGEAMRAVSVVWYTLVIIALAGLLGTAALALGIHALVESGATSQYDAMLLGVACVFAGLPTGVVQRILFAEQRTTEANIWNTAGKLASLGFVWIMVESGQHNLMVLVFGVIGVPVLVGWISVPVVFGRAAIAELRPRRTACDFRLAHHFLKLGVAFLLLQLIPYAESGIDTLLVGLLIELQRVPAFDVYSRMFNYVPALLSVGLFPLWPAIANAKSGGDTTWILRVRKLGYGLVALVSLAAALAIYSAAGLIVELWTRQSLQLDAAVVAGMAAFSFLSGIGMFQSMMLNGFGMIKEQLAIAAFYVTILLIVKVAASLTVGLAGLIWATDLCFLVRLYLLNRLFRGT